jgi:hypothetical protein
VGAELQVQRPIEPSRCNGGLSGSSRHGGFAPRGSPLPRASP